MLCSFLDMCNILIPEKVGRKRQQQKCNKWRRKRFSNQASARVVQEVC